MKIKYTNYKSMTKFSNREIVLAKIKQNGCIFQCFSTEFKKDMEIVF
jgi:hypothetical protein